LEGLKKNYGVTSKTNALKTVEKLVGEIENLESERDNLILEIDKELDDYESRANPEKRQVQQA
jgi:hypothetical protein